MPLFLARRQSSRTQAIRIGLRYLLLATYYFIMLLLNYVIFSPETVILSLGRAWLEIQKKKSKTSTNGHTITRPNRRPANQVLRTV